MNELTLFANEKITRKQKQRPMPDNAYRQDIVTCICCYMWVELITT